MPTPRRRGRTAAASVLTTALLCSVWTGGAAAAATAPPGGTPAENTTADDTTADNTGPTGTARPANVAKSPARTTAPVTKSAAPSATSAPTALYGRQDPSRDGVYRQSLAIAALASVDTAPAPAAVDWLLGQQCANGGFTAYRADPGVPCDPAREDTVSTAAAIEALAALRTYDTQAARGAEWLRATQLADGSFAAVPGPAAVGDPTSTAAAISALVAARSDPELLRSPQGVTPTQSLIATQAGCAAPQPVQGSFGPAPGDPLTSAWATLALAYGTRPTEAAASASVTPLTCPGAPASRVVSAQGGAAWLIGALRAGGDHAGGPNDFDATTATVQALSATGHRAEAGAALDWLAAGAKNMAGNDPTRLASLLLAAQTTGRTVTTFGGLDLPNLLAATGPAPAATPDLLEQGNTVEGPEDHTLRDTIAAVVAVLLGATLIVGMRRRNE